MMIRIILYYNNNICLQHKNVCVRWKTIVLSFQHSIICECSILLLYGAISAAAHTFSHYENRHSHGFSMLCFIIMYIIIIMVVHFNCYGISAVDFNSKRALSITHILLYIYEFISKVCSTHTPTYTNRHTGAQMNYVKCGPRVVHCSIYYIENLHVILLICTIHKMGVLEEIQGEILYRG